MAFKQTRRRVLTSLATLVVAGGLGACDNFLAVQNPGAINDSDLNDPLLIKSMFNTVTSDFQSMYDNLAFAGALLTDEGVNGHNFEQWRDIDLRKIDPANSILSTDIYQPLAAARFSADSLAGRVKTISGDTASAATKLGLARMRAYGGYTYVMLGEMFCQAPINLSKAYTSDELLEMSLPRFDEAIKYATEAKAAGAKAASADSIINLAKVGAARASLNLGKTAKAIEYATGVPASFSFTVAYSDNTAYPNNLYYAATTGTSKYLGVDAAFRDLKVAGLPDVRVTHTAAGTTGHNGLTILFTPFQSPVFTEYAPGSQTPFSRATGIRIASGLEARYIIAEAQGATPSTLAFVNERRNAGANQTVAPLVTVGDELMAELRDQRRRDFFLDGHRLGDLRRYKKLYNVDQFPSGQHPNAQWGNYGSAECFVPSLAESIGNPNYK